MATARLQENLTSITCLIVGEETIENSTVARMTLWGLASGSAEIFADIALCPFEMTKVVWQLILYPSIYYFPTCFIFDLVLPHFIHLSLVQQLS